MIGSLAQSLFGTQTNLGQTSLGQLGGGAVTAAQRAQQAQQGPGEAISSMSGIGAGAASTMQPQKRSSVNLNPAEIPTEISQTGAKVGDSGFGTQLTSGTNVSDLGYGQSMGVESRQADSMPPKNENMMGQSQLMPTDVNPDGFSRPEEDITSMFKPQQRQEDQTFNPTQTI